MEFWKQRCQRPCLQPAVTVCPSLVSCTKHTILAHKKTKTSALTRSIKLNLDNKLYASVWSRNMRLFKRFSNGVINFASVDVVKRKKNEIHWIWMRMSDRFEKVNCKKKKMHARRGRKYRRSGGSHREGGLNEREKAKEVPNADLWVLDGR